MINVEKQLNLFRKQDRVLRGLFFAISCLLVVALVVGFRLSTDFESGMKRSMAPPPGWVEQTYLDKNPDVAAAVRGGTFESGWQHYLLHGIEEGRAGVTLPK
jgi:hypothetical protein